MRKLPNIHPGEVLLEEFLTPMALQASYDLEEARTRLGGTLSRLATAAA
jgi:plasmid maintenance system antidote protein VapI